MVEAVKQQLANIHPEVILFMSKIKRLTFREDNQNRVNTISVSKEIEFRTVKDHQSESFTLDLSAKENGMPNCECSYYMWRQTFPVKEENRVEGRKEVENWVITLAFPVQERVMTKNRVGAGIYAFLPTEMVTALPFIIQADFLLVSSRESIRWDSKWNQGILDCVPSAFCAAFNYLVKSQVSAPPSSRSYFFDKYLPISYSSYTELRTVRDAIQAKLKTHEIILCEGPNIYCTPLQARRILPAFRNILQKAEDGGLEKPCALWSTGAFVVHPCMDDVRSLDFLGVQNVYYDWYSICINGCGSAWVAKLSEDLYVQLLCFVADKWRNGAFSSGFHQFRLFKYLTDGHIQRMGWASLSEISSSRDLKIYYSSGGADIAWLTRRGTELGDAAQYKFMPNATQMAMNKLGHYERSKLQEWLECYPKITKLSVSSFGQQILEEGKASSSKEFVIRVAQFFHFSNANDYISSTKMVDSCSVLPVVDDSGSIIGSRRCQAKLVPASIGKWAKLMEKNPWAAQGVVALSAEYMNPPVCAAGMKGGGQEDLEKFISIGLRAVDIPYLIPLNASLPGFSSAVGEEKVVMLLEWIHQLTVTCRGSLPLEFRRSIMEGKWIYTHTGYQSPSMAFLFDGKWSSAGLQLSDLSFINTYFYKKSLVGFKSALKQIGVVVEFGEGCDVVAKHLEMHKDFAAITRLYKYLHLCRWTPTVKNSVKIWIPLARRFGGEWKDAKKCVIHDHNGLFRDRLEILENVYEAALLPYFSRHLGVPLHPRIEDYCELWLHWVASHISVTEVECRSVLSIIVKNWSHSQVYIRKQGLKLPSYIQSGSIQLSAANETFVPDDLSLKQLFQTSIKIAWYPNPSDPEIALDSLFSIYNSLGIKNISQAVQKNEVSVPNGSSLRKLQAGEGLFTAGFFKCIVGYLACPLFKLSADKRHQMVRALLDSNAYESAVPFNIVYTVTYITEDGVEKTIEKTTFSTVRWEKDKKRILIHNQKGRASLAIEFADVISKGLLSEHPDLVAGLCQMLKVGCSFKFDDIEVNEMLRHENLQLFKEDESFLLQCFPEVNAVFVPLTPPREDLGTNWRGRQRFGTPSRPVESSEEFISPALFDGWEKRLHIFKQAMNNMNQSTDNSLKMKLARLLFPSATSDEEQSESSSGFHLIKVMGDACLKMLTVSEFLGAHEAKQGIPFKLDKLLCKEALELGKCLGRGGIAGDPPADADVGECDFEMLKAIAGVAALKFYGPNL